MADEEIFDKGEPAPKPKRKLTEKQLAALAKGRAKMEEKRKMKLDKQAVKEGTEKKKEQRKVKKERKLEQEALERIKVRERARKEEEAKGKKLKEWEEKRLSVLEKTQTEEQFMKLKSVLDTLDEEDILDDNKLISKLTQAKEELEKQ
jgi:hypothetical protein